MQLLLQRYAYPKINAVGPTALKVNIYSIRINHNLHNNISTGKMTSSVQIHISQDTVFTGQWLVDYC